MSLLPLLVSAAAKLRGLFDASPDAVQARNEAFLATSADIHELESRMRQLDSGHAWAFPSGHAGIFRR